MDSFEFNKIAMAVLGTVFVLFCVSLVSEGIFHAEAPEEPAYILAEMEDGPDDGPAEDQGPAFEPVSALLAAADADAGENVYKKCASCHTLEQGGANKVGPNLWNIVNRDIAAGADFSYSEALKSFGQGEQWTYEELNGFLWKPKTYVKGTAMGFVGLKDVEDRANVIEYLRGFADTPAPLPEPQAAMDGEEMMDGAAPESAEAQADGENAGDASAESGESAGDDGASQ